MQTIRELGWNIWSHPWLAAVLHGLNRLHLGFTYAAISAALLTLQRVVGNRIPEPSAGEK